MTPRFALCAVSLGLALGAASPVLGAEPSPGRELFQQKCARCHTTAEDFTRENRKVHTLEGLRRQVEHCAAAAQADWGPHQMAEVVAYLNRAYYRLP